MITMFIMMVIMVIIKKTVVKMRMDEWTDATDQLAASARAGRSSNPLHHHEARILNPGMDGEAIFFTGRGGVGSGKAKSLWGGAGNAPLPTVRGRQGKSQNLGGGDEPGRGIYCVY